MSLSLFDEFETLFNDPFFSFPRRSRVGQQAPQVQSSDQQQHQQDGAQRQTSLQQQQPQQQQQQQQLSNWGAWSLMNPTVAPPLVNFVEKKDSYQLDAEVPGMKKEDVKITVDNGYLTISGERKEDRKEETDTFHRIEHYSGKFQRTMRLPRDANVDQIAARMDNGILHVTLPKATLPDTSKRIQIN